MKFIKVTLVLVICSYLFGCASGAKKENMAFHGDQKEYSAELQKNLRLGEVSGGEKTNPAWTSEIDNEAFSGAVKESLKSQGLYSDNGEYRLEVNMIKVYQPLFGLDLKVTTHVRYILTNVNSGAVVFDDTVIAAHTAGVGDAFIAIKRLRLANEGSARKNIEGLLKKLLELRIEPKEISLAK
ncbi:MAG: hypothetical protein KC471_08550 [Flavobacteriaceae bacterium]|nr:hypothetical protein [Flavobacteriaceae bacterium]